MTEERFPCPACGRADLETFYALDDIPAHSTLMLDSREAAVGYPRGRMRLACCPACGFISNTAFDVGLNEYCTMCEETQGFSPYFQQWLHGLAQDYVDRYDLRDADVVEIGCGKGEFLALVCDLGGNHGVGIDPSYIDGRVALAASERVRFVNELYGPGYGPLEADAVVCRHTLEHIGPVGEFVGAVHESVADRPDTLVFFELPDVLRVLEENAFWDIYYEHCSYFTPGSLTRLFRGKGFDPIELRLEYADQYILLDSRPQPPSGQEFALEHDLPVIHKVVEQFRHEVPQRLDGYRAMLREAAASGRRVAVWGGGSKGVAFLTTLGVGPEVQFAVDVDPNKEGTFIVGSGHEIVAPSFMAEFKPDLVLVMNPIYLDEIGRQLAGMGLEPELIGV
jgi:SAM-dependent methyltransferase